MVVYKAKVKSTNSQEKKCIFALLFFRLRIFMFRRLLISNAQNATMTITKWFEVKVVVIEYSGTIEQSKKAVCVG